MTDLEIIEEVNKWFSKNHHMFKTDEYYGIDIVCELYKLVNKCASDGGVLGFSTGDSKGQRRIVKI